MYSGSLVCPQRLSVCLSGLLWPYTVSLLHFFYSEKNREGAVSRQTEAEEVSAQTIWQLRLFMV